MRSELIFGAVAQVSNRFLLTKLLAKATRRFHTPGIRIQDTTNDVLTRFTRSNPIAELQVISDPTVRRIRSRRHPVNAFPARPPVSPESDETSTALSDAMRVLEA